MPIFLRQKQVSIRVTKIKQHTYLLLEKKVWII